MTDAAALLAEPVPLPCGATLPNRLAKAAMTERLADPAGLPTPRHERLYRAWSEGGAGLLITGNVMVDRDHLEAPGNVVLDGPSSPALRTALASWAKAATAAGNHAWVQLSHSGRQTPIIVNKTPKAPSPIPVALPGKQFGVPVALTEPEIGALIERFASAAETVRDAGFTGVQIHAAHGYLLSSFLSPRANERTDSWGGDLAGRARLLLEIVRAVRGRVGDDFPVSVKLNSADFQRGGFAWEDSRTVASWLDAEKIDLLEISGGSYEQPAMMKLAGLEPVSEPNLPASTRAREAYFQKFAPDIRAVLTRAKLMVTGGFRTADGMAEAVRQDGVDVIGLGRPLSTHPDAPRRLLDGGESMPRWEDRLRLGRHWFGPSSPVPMLRAVNGFAVQGWYYEQLQRLADTGRPDTTLSVFRAFLADQRGTRRRARARASQR